MPALGNADAVTPTLVADVSGKYRVKLVVSNGVVASEPAFADIAVGACGGHAPAVTPSASTSVPHVGEVVMLSAEAADDDTKAGCTSHPSVYGYAWTLSALPPGSHAMLNATDVRAPSFVTDLPGSYAVQVVATDPTGRKSPTAELKIEASTCGSHAPVIDQMGPSVAAPETGDTVSLTASVTDADTSPGCAAHDATFAYDWSFTALPAGSHAALNDRGVASPSFVPDVEGSYSLELAVTDPTGRRATAKRELDVTARVDPNPVDDDCGEYEPTALPRVLSPGPIAACDKVVALNLQGGSRILLDGAASTDLDNTRCGMNQSLDFEWTLLTTPITGGRSELESRDGGTSVLHVTADGGYKVRLVVTDSTGLSSQQATCWIHAGNVGQE
jgi:hypothetical protein